MENIAFFKQNAMKRVSYHNIGHTRFMADFYIRIDYIFLNWDGVIPSYFLNIRRKVVSLS